MIEIRCPNCTELIGSFEKKPVPGAVVAAEEFTLSDGTHPLPHSSSTVQCSACLLDVNIFVETAKLSREV